MGARLSPWKPKEVIILCPLPPISSDQIQINNYFPGLEISSKYKKQFECRGRIVFEYLIENILKKAKNQTDINALQKDVDDNIQKWYSQAVNLINWYIVAAVEEHKKELVGQDNSNPNTILSLLRDIFHDIVFQKRQCFLDNGVPPLVDLGLIFFQISPDNEYLVGNLIEFPACEALRHYFFSIPLEKDPIYQKLYKNWKRETGKVGNSGMCLEDLESYCFLHDLGSVKSIGNSKLLQDAITDKSLFCYQFKAVYIIKEQKQESLVESLLENRFTDRIVSPRDKEGGPDKIFFVEKILNPPTEWINAQLTQTDFDNLPQTRIWLVQDKDGKNLNGKLGHHAIQTICFQKIPYKEGKSKEKDFSEKMEEDDNIMKTDMDLDQK